MEPTLLEILDAREARAQRQRELLKQYEKPLLCFTMNIPGPVKLDRDVSVGFFVGCSLLKQALADKLLHFEAHYNATGCECCCIADMPARELKRVALDLEDIAPIGRLFDMDVIDTRGNKVSREEMGYPRRQCLICEKDAYECAGRRTHSLEELLDRTGFLLYMTARQYFCEFIAVQAYSALIREVNVTPKPGLVDRNNSGAHKDMDIRHFFASANALRPYFCECAETGYLTRHLSPAEAFARIRPRGMAAEQTMLRATYGANTHKGAIFSLGILCAAAGRVPPHQWSAARLLDQCAAMTEGLTAGDFAGVTSETAKTAGERLYAQYGITGVRGQAEAGFPAVQKVGLPIYRQALQKGLSQNDAGCIALLHMLAAVDDTNLIKRGGRQTQLEIKSRLAALLEKEPFPALSLAQDLDREFIAKNLSPGGTADLLALTYFLDALT